MLDRVLKGDVPAKYLNDRSKLEFDLLVSLFRNGYAETEILDIVAENPELFAKTDKREQRYFDQTIFRAWNTASQSVIKWDTDKILFSGRTKYTDNRVYMALCEIARRTGKIKFSVSTRDLANLANIEQPKTISKATYRLAERKLIIKRHFLKESGKQQAINEYELINPIESENNRYSKILHSGTVSECSNLEYLHPLFSNRGIKYTGYLVLVRLDTETFRPPKEIYEGVMAQGTFSKVMKRLARVVNPTTGEIIILIEKNERGEYRRIDFDADEIAKFIGVDKIVEHRKQRFKNESQRYRGMEDKPT